MARTHARIATNLWADGAFRKLSGPAQLLYLHLLSSESLSFCGVADWRPGRISAVTRGSTKGSIEAAGAELAAALFVVIDEESEEVLVRSFVRHDGLMKEPRMGVALAKAWGATASETIRGVVVHEMKRLHAEDPKLRGWELVGNPSKPGPAKAILEAEEVEPKDAPTPHLGDGLGLSLGDGLGDGLGQTRDRVWVTATPSPSPAPTPSPPEGGVGGDDDFEVWWEAYPRKTAKGGARKAYAKATTRTDPATLLAAVKAQQFNPDPKFIPHPTTWLNQERWTDAPVTQPTGPRPPTGYDSRGGITWDKIPSQSLIDIARAAGDDELADRRQGELDAYHARMQELLARRNAS